MGLFSNAGTEASKGRVPPEDPTPPGPPAPRPCCRKASEAVCGGAAAPSQRASRSATPGSPRLRPGLEHVPARSLGGRRPLRSAPRLNPLGALTSAATAGTQRHVRGAGPGATHAGQTVGAGPGARHVGREQRRSGGRGRRWGWRKGEESAATPCFVGGSFLPERLGAGLRSSKSRQVVGHRLTL